MKGRWLPRRGIRWLIGLLLAAASFRACAEFGAEPQAEREACERPPIIARLPSPDGAWEAVLYERICQAGLLAMTDVTAGVQLVPTRDPSRVGTILGVSTGGNEDERPRLTWTTPDVLRVTVPNISYLKVLRCDFDGVRIDLRFDPDDPETRAAWRRKRGASAERHCTDEAR